MPTRWTVKRQPDNGVHCSLCKAATIYLEPIPTDKIRLLMEEYPHTEWIGYLVGKENPDSGDIFVEDIIIPPHEEANGASCLAEPFHIPKQGCIGVIHSHHSMGAFHSGQDDHTVDRNFPISITVAKRNNNLEWDAISHMKTPCGRHTLLKCSVRYVQPDPLFDRKKWLKGAKEHIDKGKLITVYKHREVGVTKPSYPKVQGDKVIIGKDGVVMTKREYQALMKDILGGQEGDYGLET